ncbi:hypothetical protein, partial [Nonomuraea zeae]|uniref:hypothetical protein n=1 Tax=Nonomuraea zeae TaxID=1642303 RepID=UPI0019801125
GVGENEFDVVGVEVGDGVGVGVSEVGCGVVVAAGPPDVEVGVAVGVLEGGALSFGGVSAAWAGSGAGRVATDDGSAPSWGEPV